MKVLDLFSGIGGFRMGFEMAGHEAVGWVEWDKHARKSYEAIHQPEGEWTHDDIRTIESRSIPKADVWTFGFPCQDISVAGNQKGFSGERSSLFFTVTKFLREIKEEDPSSLPSYLLIENVKNFLSVNGGWDFLLALAELDEVGYDCEWELLNSKNFGVAQNRERVFIVGHLRGRSTRKVFPVRGESPKASIKQLVGGSQGERIYDPQGLSVTLSANGGGLGAKTGLYLITKQHEKIVPRDLFTCLDANYYKGLDNHGARTGVLEVRAVLTPDRAEKRQNGRRMKELGEPMFTLTAQDRHGIAIIDDQGRTNKKHKLKDICPTLRAQTHGNEPKVIIPGPNDISKTIRTGGKGSLDGKHTWDCIQDQNYRIRKLTPRETWRLQGFPDWAFDRAKEAGVSDSQLYKQAGNSVTVNVIYAIAKEMEIAKRG